MPRRHWPAAAISALAIPISLVVPTMTGSAHNSIGVSAVRTVTPRVVDIAGQSQAAPAFAAQPVPGQTWQGPVSADARAPDIQFAASSTQLLEMDEDHVAIFDRSAYAYFPALAVDAQGDLFCLYNTSSAAQYIGIRLASQAAGGPTGSLTGVTGLFTSSAAYTGSWGHFAAGATDPDGIHAWLAGAYPSGSSHWIPLATEVTR